MTAATRQIYNGNSLTDISAGAISAVAHKSIGTKVNGSSSNSGNIDISEGYFITKVVVAAYVTANDVNSYAKAYAYAVFTDGTQEYIGGLDRSRYTTPTSVTYDLTSTWSSEKIFKVKSIYATTSAHRGDDDGHGDAASGGSASVTVYQRGMPWVIWDE